MDGCHRSICSSSAAAAAAAPGFTEDLLVFSSVQLQLDIPTGGVLTETGWLLLVQQ
jgi:hypothetical protein